MVDTLAGSIISTETTAARFDETTLDRKELEKPDLRKVCSDCVEAVLADIDITWL